MSSKKSWIDELENLKVHNKIIDGVSLNFDSQKQHDIEMKIVESINNQYKALLKNKSIFINEKFLL